MHVRTAACRPEGKIQNSLLKNPSEEIENLTVCLVFRGKTSQAKSARRGPSEGRVCQSLGGLIKYYIVALTCYAYKYGPEPEVN